MTADARTIEAGVGALALAVMMMAALCAVPAGVGAQGLGDRVGLELRGGVAVGNYTDSDAGLDLAPRPSFGATVEVAATEMLAGYLAFDRSSFGCTEGICTKRDVTFTSQGFTAGVRWSPGLPWVRAGALYHTLGVRGVGAGESPDAGVGFEVAAGADLPLWQTVRIRPGVTYRRHRANSDGVDAHVALLAVEVGLAVGLGDR